MPIDPSIALGVKVPQIDTSGVMNALAHGRQMQMEQQRLAMQQEAHAQQMKLNDVTLQQHQQAQDDDKAARDLFANAPNATPEEVMAKLGPRVGAPIVKQMRDQETARLSVGKAKAEQMANIAGTMNDETSYHRGIDIGLQRGLIDQQQAATLHAQPWNEETQAHVKQLSLEATEAAKQHDMKIADVKEAHDAVMRPLEEKKAQGDLAESGLKAGAAQRQQDASNLAVAAKQGPDALAQAMSRLYSQSPQRFQAFRGLTAQASPDDILAVGQTANEQVTAGLTRERNAATKANEEAMRKNAAGHLGIAQSELGIHRQELATKQAEADPYGNLGVNKNPIKAPVDASGAELHGDEYLKTLPPTLAAKVRAVAEGRQPIPTSRGGVLKGEGKAISDAVYNYDQGFSTQRAQVRSDFAKDKNIGSLNTAAVHLDQFMDAAAALKNGSFRPGNAAFNAVKEMFGDTAPTNFEMLKNVAVGEAANALKGSATDVEIASIKKGLDRANSPEQFEGALKELMRTYGAKLNTYQERYTQLNPGDKAWSPVLPSAKAAFQKRGVSESGRPSASGSTTANRKPLSEIFK